MPLLLNLNSYLPIGYKSDGFCRKTLQKLSFIDTFCLELEDVEEAALIDLMCCSCKQAATGIPPPGRSAYKKVSSFIYGGKLSVLGSLLPPPGKFFVLSPTIGPLPPKPF